MTGGPKTPRHVLEGASRDATLLPPLSEAALAEFQRRLVAPLPADIADLLRYASGFRRAGQGEVSFTGVSGAGFAEALPVAVTLLSDDAGNFWAVDVNRESGAWGAVFFASHDPPVLVIQAPDLATFLLQVLQPEETVLKLALEHIRTVAAMRIWKEDPWVVPMDEARRAQDQAVAKFAAQLRDNFRVADLRAKEIGSGFSWGRAGPNAEVRRNGAELIFGVEQKAPSFLGRLLGRSS
jgi:hypothetical protein